jgi:hypothetical protein
MHDDIPREPRVDWVLQHVTVPDNFEVAWTIAKRKVCAVSDGSFKDSHGTAAWMIYVSADCVITGRCITPGPSTSQSAYRSKLAGLYCIVYYVRFLERSKNLKGIITVGCDGLSALTQASRAWDFINPNEPQYDLIMAIRSLVAESNWEWQWKHVKGHQDESHSLEQLDDWSKWNIQMDADAKKFWKETSPQKIYPKIEGEPWKTTIATEMITSNLKDFLREKCNFSRAMEYWSSKNRFGSCNTDAIDWESMGMAMAASTRTRQHWVSKTISGFCSTGKTMKRRKERPTDECPRCGEPEDTCHVWRCNHETQDLWNKALERLSEWLSSNSTPPEIRMAIIQGLNQWRRDERSEWSSYPEWLRNIILKQSSCGWRNFFEGFLIQEWREAMARQLHKIGSSRSPKRWMSALIRRLWQIAWDLWEHRNGYLHAKDDSLLIRQTNEKIKYQFILGTATLDGNSRTLFRIGVAALLKKPMDVKQQWVKRVELARQLAMTGEHDTYRNERSAMARWLGQG